jgi:hypothetical protein
MLLLGECRALEAVAQMRQEQRRRIARQLAVELERDGTLRLGAGEGGFAR